MSEKSVIPSPIVGGPAIVETRRKPYEWSGNHAPMIGQWYACVSLTPLLLDLNLSIASWITIWLFNIAIEKDHV